MYKEKNLYGNNMAGFNLFKDRLFDLINDADDLGICDITADDKNNIFTVGMEDGSTYKIKCMKMGS